jgi:hypothetical protein
MNGSDDRRPVDVIEDALRTYPLAPVPASLKTRVMNGVWPASIDPRFTFPWLEAAISLTCSILLTAVLSLLLNIPPAAAVRMENITRLFLLQPASRSILLAVGTSMILTAACLMAAVRLFETPFSARTSARR